MHDSIYLWLHLNNVPLKLIAKIKSYKVVVLQILKSNSKDFSTVLSTVVIIILKNKINLNKKKESQKDKFVRKQVLSMIYDKSAKRQTRRSATVGRWSGGKRYNSIHFILINPNFPHLILNIVILDINLGLRIS